MGETALSLRLNTPADKSSYIRFYFTAKNAEKRCEKGYEVCFDQLLLNEVMPAEKTPVSGTLRVECSAETSDKVTFLPRLGIRLFMPESFSRADYFCPFMFLD